MQVDHILPESLLADPILLAKVLKTFGLPAAFDLNSYENWLPACAGCNRAKSNTIFEPTPIVQIHLQNARAKSSEVRAQALQAIGSRKISSAISVLLAVPEETMTPEMVEPLIDFLLQRFPAEAQARLDYLKSPVFYARPPVLRTIAVSPRIQAIIYPSGVALQHLGGTGLRPDLRLGSFHHVSQWIPRDFTSDFDHSSYLRSIAKILSESADHPFVEEWAHEDSSAWNLDAARETLLNQLQRWGNDRNAFLEALRRMGRGHVVFVYIENNGDLEETGMALAASLSSNAEFVPRSEIHLRNDWSGSAGRSAGPSSQYRLEKASRTEHVWKIDRLPSRSNIGIPIFFDPCNDEPATVSFSLRAPSIEGAKWKTVKSLPARDELDTKLLNHFLYERLPFQPGEMAYLLEGASNFGMVEENVD
jgi:hypothetical protein